MKVSVKVPATTANIGPGFDCLGMALPLYNTITIEETVLPGTGVEINVISESSAIGELKINIHSSIPVARGLGSSASVVVGALIAANELLGHPADEVALLSIASELEGHPDNITPAIIGGLVLASQEDDGTVIYRKLEWPSEWAITVCIPDFELSTDIARSVLPKEVPMKDAIFNAQRLGMFVQAVHTKDTELMKLALKDKLHQPYRMKLMPGLDKIMDNLRFIDSVLGCVISGAGSSILVISEKNDLDKIKNVVKETWADQNIKCEIRTMNVEQNGAQIVSNED